MHYFPSDIGNTVLATHRNEVHFDIRCRPDISEDEVLPPREKSAMDLLVVHDDISVCNVECCGKYNKLVAKKPRGVAMRVGESTVW